MVAGYDRLRTARWPQSIKKASKFSGLPLCNPKAVPPVKR